MEEMHKLKSFGDLKESYQKFKNLGSDKSCAKYCNTNIHPPLFEEDSKTIVLQKFIMPEMHVMSGVTNNLFWKGLVSLIGREKALLWPQSLHIVSEFFHGKVFDGNGCRKLLKNVDKLYELPEIKEKLQLVPIISTFKALNKIVE